jgi:hypothetical protein
VIGTGTVAPVFTSRMVKFERQLLSWDEKQKGTRELPSFFQASAGVCADAGGMDGATVDDRVDDPAPQPPVSSPRASDRTIVEAIAVRFFTAQELR